MEQADLTKSQLKVLDYVERFAETEHRSPTLKEIADGVGSAAVSTVHKHVTHLIDKGFLERRRGQGNNLVRRADSPRGSEAKSMRASAETGQEAKVLPCYGDVAAGAPLPAESFAVPMEVPHAIHRDKENLFVLRVKGDSMVDASILDGDLVVLQRRGEYRNGDRVVALIDREEATLKELRHDNDGVWLIPHNPDFSPRHYPLDRIEVQGVLVGVMRSC